MVKVSIQGERASFHDIAARQFFGDSVEPIFCDTFAKTLASLTNGDADAALCAIENSLYGSINEVYDLILKHKLCIYGEVYLRIDQCLIGVPGTNLSDIKTVYSHPVALAQCEAYLDKHLPQAQRLEYHDTAGSVAMIHDLNDRSIAAIAGHEAAKLYGMDIIADSIETHKQNFTRFAVLGTSTDAIVSSPNKTSLVVRTNHSPGALYEALGVFAKRGINLSKIQSRPIIGKAWHYMFYLDVDAGLHDPAYVESVGQLTEQGCEVTLLGSYKNSRIVAA